MAYEDATPEESLAMQNAFENYLVSKYGRDIFKGFALTPWHAGVVHEMVKQRHPDMMAIINKFNKTGDTPVDLDKVRAEVNAVFDRYDR